jgi:hypothetical protein
VAPGDRAGRVPGGLDALDLLVDLARGRAERVDADLAVRNTSAQRSVAVSSCAMRRQIWLAATANRDAVAGLVDLTPSDRYVTAESLADRRRQRLGTVDDEEAADSGNEPRRSGCPANACRAQYSRWRLR